MKTKLIKIFRWTLRIISSLFIVFFLFMFIGQVFFDGGGESAPKPWTFNEVLQLSVFGIGMIGFILAWKWELLGGIIALLAYVGVALINPLVLKPSPVYIYPVVALLFIVLWAICRNTTVKSE